MSFSVVFHIHLHNHLKSYSFFKIGTDHDYENTQANVENTWRYVQECLLPTTHLLKQVLTENPELQVALAISGTALDLFQKHQPKAIEALQQLVSTQQVGFVTTPYYHSAASEYSVREWHTQIQQHQAALKAIFRVESTVYMASAWLPHTAEQLDSLVSLGIQQAVVRQNTVQTQQIQVIPIEQKLSEIIEKRFSDKSWEFYPLYADQYLHWLQEKLQQENHITLFWDMQTFGLWNTSATGIFDFLAYFLKNINQKMTCLPLSAVNTTYEVSSHQETPLLQTRLQTDALQKLFLLEEKLEGLKENSFIETWRKLQDLDYFLQMSADKCLPTYRTPYDAYINYMNILSDFEMMVRFSQKTAAANKKK
jgi:alpha-amylase